jgi:U3 small nucleolar RNA-associated protein 6
MERVQFQQEQMLHELKDLVEKSLFTEVRIVKVERGFFSQELV